MNQQAREATGQQPGSAWNGIGSEAGSRVTGELAARFGLLLLSQTQASQAWELVGTAWTFRKRFESALGYSGRIETAVVFEDPEAYDAVTAQEEDATPKTVADRSRLGCTMLADGSQLGSVADGSAVARKNGQRGRGIETHMC
jgi:hypothetical protein